MKLKKSATITSFLGELFFTLIGMGRSPVTEIDNIITCMNRVSICARGVQTSSGRRLLLPLLTLVPWLTLALGLPVVASEQRTAPSMMVTTEIKFWVGGMSPALRDYQIELVRQALERTADDHPPYHITYNYRPMSGERSKIETERGTNVHIHFSSEWQGQFVDSDNVHMLRFPFLKQMLGLRKCITRQSMLPRFDDVTTMDAFNQLAMGQQRGWSDNLTYTQRGMTLVEAEDYQSLYPMLERGRFDCLPMSVLEIDRAVADQLDRYPDLVVVPGVYIYYPIWVYLSVTKFQPGLAERLQEGLTMVFADGTADRLFNKHYKAADTQLKDPGARLFILDNPAMPDATNQAVINEFLAGSRRAQVAADRTGR